MKVLGEMNYSLISMAVKIRGTFDPKRVMPLILEELHSSEFEEIQKFLQWVHNNGKCFGSGNYESVFKEFNQQRDKMKSTARKFVAQFRMTNKDQSIDCDATKVFDDLNDAKIFLCNGLNTCEAVWGVGGIAISSGQIVEELWSLDENPDLPFPMYRETERIATYVPLLKNGWERIDDVQ